MRWIVALSLLTGCYERVGGSDCGGTEVVAPAQFCTDEQFWICRRDEYAGRISSEEFAECQAQIPAFCEGAEWNPGCCPTQAEADSCILLLQREDLAELTYEELRATSDDCNLCP